MDTLSSKPVLTQTDDEFEIDLFDDVIMTAEMRQAEREHFNWMAKLIVSGGVDVPEHVRETARALIEMYPEPPE